MRLSPTLIALSLFASICHAAVDYTAQIKPLLQAQCVKCHGATTQKGRLRLDTAVGARTGGDHGPAIQPKQAEASLIVQVITGSHAEIAQMPYKRGPLDSAQIALIRQWIAEGAHAPADEKPSDDRHWAYLPPQRPTPPQAGHPIDAFIRDQLSRQGLAPSPLAAPETLLRRLYLDLIGLPPKPEEIAAFVNESNPSALLPAVIDRLLASPHYGERWGRWWLDQARYADSNGYSIDAPRSIWPYRDWVVRSLNADLPFDQFTIEQIAGDLLPNSTTDQKIATGFHRNTQINQEGGIDKEQFRIESVFDRVATTSTVWLGLTIACAQCHDHKFDAISQKEYYQLFAFFNNQDEPTLPLPDPQIDALTPEFNTLQKQLTAHFQTRLDALHQWESALTAGARQKLDRKAQDALNIPADKRSFAHLRSLFQAAFHTQDATFHDLNRRLSLIEQKRQNRPTTLVLTELPKPRETRLFIKGDFTRPAEQVHPATPAVLHDLPAKDPTRLDFARWLVRRDNPLTARVIVNRVWQQYFGRGLVETENDFGTMGSAPSHPELLDWLAVEFMEHHWSLRHLHRLIVTSATYQQRSAIPANSLAAAKDAKNTLLWRQNRLRLDAEIIRDIGLAASGLLVPTIGGPPVYPPIPEGVLALGQVKRTWPLSQGNDRYRRALYTFVFRATPPPALSVFDGPDGFSTCTRRLRSNTPLQALTLLNDTAHFEFAQALAKMVRQHGQAYAFQRCTGRLPTQEERKSLAKLSPDEAARVLLNLDETITRE